MHSRHIFLLAAMLIAVAFVYLAGLDRLGIFGPDEPRYAAIGVEMAHSGDWITPRLWGRPWFEKSPLLYWMTATASLIGLGPETAPRAPVALAALSLPVFFYLFLKSHLGHRIAFHSAILLAGSAGWAAFGGVSVTDLPLAGAMTVCVLLVVYGGPAWLAGVFLGLAVLAKGLVPLVLFMPLTWWLYRSKRLVQLLPIALALLVVAGPWYTIITLRHGRAFFDEFIVKHHFARFSSDSLQHVRPFWFYVPGLAGLIFPWTGLLPFIAGSRILSDKRLKFLLLWTAWGFIFFCVSRNKLYGYILPLIPVLCILIAAAIEDHKRWTGPILAAMAAILAALDWALLPGIGQFLAGGGIALVLVAWKPLTAALLAGIVCAGLARWGQITPLLCVVALLMLTPLAVIRLGPLTAEIDQAATARPLSRTADRGGCVHPNDRDLRYGLSYYWGFEVPDCNDDTLPRRIRKPGP